MNWRWKHIIICGIIGLVIGIIPAIGGGGFLYVILCLLGAELLYFGFRMTRVWLGLTAAAVHTSNLSGLAKLILYIVAISIAGIIGWYAFPKAIFDAVKNVD